MARVHKRVDPVEAAYAQKIAARDPANWGVAVDRDLPMQADVDTEHDFKGRVRRAFRMDVFARLFYRRGCALAPQSYDAVRRFQKDLAIMHATQGASDAIRTSSSVAHWLVANFTIGRADAGRRLWDVMQGMPAQSSKLLCALSEPEVVEGKSRDWHAVTLRITGLKSREKHSEAVVNACDDLAASYREIDNRPR